MFVTLTYLVIILIASGNSLVMLCVVECHFGTSVCISGANLISIKPEFIDNYVNCLPTVITEYAHRSISSETLIVYLYNTTRK